MPARRALKGIIAAAVALAVTVAMPLHAHHTFSGIYDQSRSVTLQGTVQEFHFVHPHPFIVIESVSASGLRESWRAEMDNRFELEDIGITADTFKRGDKVAATGSPGRAQPQIMYLWNLQRAADGLHYWQVGVTPYLELTKPR